MVKSIFCCIYLKNKMNIKIFVYKYIGTYTKNQKTKYYRINLQKDLNSYHNHH